MPHGLFFLQGVLTQFLQGEPSWGCSCHMGWHKFTRGYSLDKYLAPGLPQRFNGFPLQKIIFAWGFSLGAYLLHGAKCFLQGVTPWRRSFHMGQHKLCRSLTLGLLANTWADTKFWKGFTFGTITNRWSEKPFARVSQCRFFARGSPLGSYLSHEMTLFFERGLPWGFIFHMGWHTIFKGFFLWVI